MDDGIRPLGVELRGVCPEIGSYFEVKPTIWACAYAERMLQGRSPYRPQQASEHPQT